MKNQLLQKLTCCLTLAASILLDAASANAANVVNLSITSPTANQAFTNAIINISGKASGTLPLEEVFYKLNDGPFAEASGTSNWTASVTLIPGTNTLQVYAQDTSLNTSSLAQVSFFYAVKTPLELNLTGKGTFNPNYSGQLLDIGVNYTTKATAAAGFAFTNWSGAISSTNATLTFLMSEGLVLTANFVDIQKPTVAISEPTSGLRVSNATYTVTGKASDNVEVGSVFCQVNDGSWTPAQSANNWTNWTADVTLKPGTNIIQAYSLDTSGNSSTIASTSFVYVLSAVLTVSTNGDGTVSPNDNGALLAIGTNYTIKAAAAPGFDFVNWTGGTSLPLSVLTNGTTVKFSMASNLMLQANFTDITPPSLAITAPKPGLDVSNSAFTVTGTAKDNVGVASVSYQLNGGSWLTTTTSNNWTNWSVMVDLTSGTNTIKAYASDAAGNNSTTQNVGFVYILSAVLTVSTNGDGTVSPNDNGALLEINKNYSLKATAASGFGFVNWTGGTSLPLSILTNGTTVQFSMASNLMLQANFKDVTPPSLTITAPKSGSNVSNAFFTITGTAKDNVGVASVFCQLNGGMWVPATTSNNWTNWSAAVTLNPGTNTIKAYALDGTDNSSAIESASCDYIVSAMLTVTTNGNGTVSPNDNGALLEINKSYTLKATAASGFGFVNWTGGTSLPLSVLTNGTTVQFLMTSNLMLQANFKDITPPKLTITAPTSGQKVASSAFMLIGTASDNVGVVSVFYNFNSGGWNPAQTVNGWTNWLASLTLTPGTNTVQAYSEDAAGNVSPTASVTFDYVVPPDWAPDSLSDLTATVTAEGQPSVKVGFGTDTFSQSQSLTDTNNDSGVGTYSYTKLSTNTAQLTIDFTLPPTDAVESNLLVNLTFTALNSGVFINPDSTGGTVSLSSATNLAPASLTGVTITASGMSGPVTLKLGNGTFSQKQTGSTSTNSGTYVYEKFSPMGAMLTLTYTSPTDKAGYVAYVELTFSASHAGDYFLTKYDNLGNFNNSSIGTFSTQ